jgi:3-hydroxypropanoate dehydrogenase
LIVHRAAPIPGERSRRRAAEERTNVTTSRDEEIELLFTGARTHSAWLDRPVEDDLLHRLHALVRMGPTGGNAEPLRVVFVKSREAKERLRPVLAPGNVDKTMSAPATAIVAYDARYYDKLPQLFPARPEMRDHIAAMPEATRDRMGTVSALLQAGYLILAARALGLDCGPMGGFDPAKADAAFFPDGAWRSLLLVNLGYGDRDKLFPRLPRLSFEEACRIE